MGGLVIILSVVLAYFARQADHPGRCRRASGLLLLFLLVGLGAVGFLDDYIKIAKQRSLGLRSKAKMAGQVVGRGRRSALLALTSSPTSAARPRRRGTSRSPATASDGRCPRSSWCC